MIDLKIKAMSYTWKNMSYIMLVDARGVIFNLAHEMRQNTETWFTRITEYLNTIFKKCTIAKHVSFNHKTTQLYFEKNILAIKKSTDYFDN